MAQDTYLPIGVLHRAHGIKGELSATLDAESADFLDHVARLYVGPGEDTPATALRAVSVRSWRWHNDRLLIAFKGLEDRTQAEALRGLTLFIRRQDLPPPDEDEVYLHDLVGATALLEDGATLGVIRDFLLPPGQEIWVIETPDGREVLIPAHDETVLEIDLEARVVRLAPPPGLLDIYLSAPDKDAADPATETSHPATPDASTSDTKLPS